MPSKQTGDSNQSEGSQRERSGNFANDPQRASEEGKKGSQQIQQNPKNIPPGSDIPSGNFADDPEKASEAGRKGGQHSDGGSTK